MRRTVTQGAIGKAPGERFRVPPKAGRSSRCTRASQARVPVLGQSPCRSEDAVATPVEPKRQLFKLGLVPGRAALRHFHHRPRAAYRRRPMLVAVAPPGLKRRTINGTADCTRVQV